MTTTTQSLKAILGETYFDIREEQKYFGVSTRQNGDTGNCSASSYDISEARRLAVLLRASGIVCKIEVIDEWVEIIISKTVA